MWRRLDDKQFQVTPYIDVKFRDDGPELSLVTVSNTLNGIYTTER